MKKNYIIRAIANLEQTITLINNINNHYNSKNNEVSEDALAMVITTIENTKARLLIDNCSNVNVFTIEFLEEIMEYKKLVYVKTELSKLL